MKLDELLDLPLVTLSNGQTRRARIARALMSGRGGACPELLILEEPYSTRPTLTTSRLLTVHLSRSWT